MCNNAHQSKTATGCSEMLNVIHNLQVSVAVDVLDLSHQVAKCSVASSSPVAYRCIASSKRDLDHDDVGGDGYSIMFDAPATKSFVCCSTTNTYKSVAGSSGHSADDFYRLELIWS